MNMQFFLPSQSLHDHFLQLGSSKKEFHYENSSKYG